ncbi:hypothetical protein E0Z06_10570 [Rheinheimera sp. D18]|uniref:hypothetical protein n=1 Tax=Rheinheimera sp. D18 TaxID=2545632 RepID=UPI001051E1B8|nr:hypothetical protein [Rheinheimera sp. D18]QBL09937.1 hypothetical protein E0Z06_10570 [Rheinheimera sp. D18]
MMKLNNITKSVTAALLVAVSSVVIAETVTVDATVTVNNAIDFQHTGTLDFGSLRATAGGGADMCAILTLSSDSAAPTLTAAASGATTLCTAGDTDSVIQSIGGVPARPEFTVSGVAAFTDLKLTLPTATTLSAAGLPAGAATFSLGNFTAYRTSGIAPGPITTVLATDNSGNAAFRVGAQIATHVAALGAGLNYQDGVAYKGTFDVTVEY